VWVKTEDLRRGSKEAKDKKRRRSEAEAQE
jgi:hypothetical protein